MLLALLLVSMLLLSARELHSHYPIQQWLFWRYAGAALLSAVWVIACLYSLAQVNRSPLEPDERFPTPLKPHSGAVTRFRADEDVRYLVTFRNCSQPTSLTSQGFRQLVRRPADVFWIRD